MFEKLQALEQRYDELSAMLGDPSIVSSPEKYQKTAKAHAELQDLVDAFRKHKSLSKQLLDADTIVQEEQDPELLEMARDEVRALEDKVAKIEDELKILLIPKDPNDGKSVILEIRAGTGGDEATLFAQEIFRMYARYAERMAGRPRCSRPVTLESAGSRK